MYVCNLHYICKLQRSIWSFEKKDPINFFKSKIVWNKEITELVKVFDGKLADGVQSANPCYKLYVETCTYNFSAEEAEMGGSCGSMDTLSILICESHNNDRHLQGDEQQLRNKR